VYSVPVSWSVGHRFTFKRVTFAMCDNYPWESYSLAFALANYSLSSEVDKLASSSTVDHSPCVHLRVIASDMQGCQCIAYGGLVVLPATSCQQCKVSSGHLGAFVRFPIEKQQLQTLKLLSYLVYNLRWRYFRCEGRHLGFFTCDWYGRTLKFNSSTTTTNIDSH